MSFMLYVWSFSGLCHELLEEQWCSCREASCWVPNLWKHFHTDKPCQPWNWSSNFWSWNTRKIYSGSWRIGLFWGILINYNLFWAQEEFSSISPLFLLLESFFFTWVDLYLPARGRNWGVELSTRCALCLSGKPVGWLWQYQELPDEGKFDSVYFNLNSTCRCLRKCLVSKTWKTKAIF